MAVAVDGSRTATDKGTKLDLHGVPEVNGVALAWRNLEHAVGRHGYVPRMVNGRDTTTQWFVRSHRDEALVACIRFVAKQKMRVFTVHLGWRHETAHEFCLTALQQDWPRGYKWLRDAGVVQSPCLSLFNLAGFAQWRLGGVPFEHLMCAVQDAEISLDRALGEFRWGERNSRELLDTYVNGHEPFHWGACNSAVRLGQVAGLSSILASGTAVFDCCVADHSALIETDMFGLGSGAEWIAALRRRLAKIYVRAP